MSCPALYGAGGDGGESEEEETKDVSKVRMTNSPSPPLTSHNLAFGGCVACPKAWGKKRNLYYQTETGGGTEVEVATEEDRALEDAEAKEAQRQQTLKAQEFQEVVLCSLESEQRCLRQIQRTLTVCVMLCFAGF